MKEAIRKRPWLFIWVAFALLIGAWALLITVAVRNAPVSVPLGSEVPTAETSGEGGNDAD